MTSYFIVTTISPEIAKNRWNPKKYLEVSGNEKSRTPFLSDLPLEEVEEFWKLMDKRGGVLKMDKYLEKNIKRPPP